VKNNRQRLCKINLSIPVYRRGDRARKADCQGLENMLQKVTGDIAENAVPRTALRKTFHLNEILSVETGLPLTKEGVAAVHRLVAFMMETDADAEITLQNRELVRDCLEEQLPFLSDINFSGLASILKYDPAVDNPYIRVWAETQSLRFGEEHTLIPVSRWQRLSRQKKNADRVIHG